jgi:hypothetical protein
LHLVHGHVITIFLSGFHRYNLHATLLTYQSNMEAREEQYAAVRDALKANWRLQNRLQETLESLEKGINSNADEQAKVQATALRVNRSGWYSGLQGTLYNIAWQRKPSDTVSVLWLCSQGPSKSDSSVCPETCIACSCGISECWKGGTKGYWSLTLLGGWKRTHTSPTPSPSENGRQKRMKS